MAHPVRRRSHDLETLLREVELPKTGRAGWARAVAAEIERFVTRVAETAPSYGGEPRPAYPPAILGGGLDRAVREGERLKRDLLARPDMLTPEAAARRAGITRQALDDRRKKGRALALSHVKRGFRYPAWQFDDQVAAGVVQVLCELTHLDPWGQYLFFTQHEPLVDAPTPLEALRAGKLGSVLHAAKVLREDWPA